MIQFLNTSQESRKKNKELKKTRKAENKEQKKMFRTQHRHHSSSAMLMDMVPTEQSEKKGRDQSQKRDERIRNGTRGGTSQSQKRDERRDERRDEPEIIEYELEPVSKVAPTIIPKRGAQAYIKTRSRLELMASTIKYGCPLQTNQNVQCSNKNFRGSSCKRISF